MKTYTILCMAKTILEQLAHALAIGCIMAKPAILTDGEWLPLVCFILYVSRCVDVLLVRLHIYLSSRPLRTWHHNEEKWVADILH